MLLRCAYKSQVTRKTNKDKSDEPVELGKGINNSCPAFNTTVKRSSSDKAYILPFGKRYVAINIYNICKGHFGS